MPCGWRWRLIVHQLLVAPLLRRRREQRDRVHLRLSSAVRHNPWASPLLYYSIRCIFLSGRLAAAAAATHQHGDLRTAEAPAARRLVRTLYHSTQLWAGSRQNGEVHGGGGELLNQFHGVKCTIYFLHCERRADSLRRESAASLRACSNGASSLAPVRDAIK